MNWPLKLALTLAVCTSLAGCKDAVVISTDGTTELGYCGAGFVATCVAKFCKAGSYTLAGADQIEGDAVIRCLGPDTDAGAVSR